MRGRRLQADIWSVFDARHFPLAPTLDHVGLMGRSVDDVARLVQALGRCSSGGSTEPRFRVGIIRNIPPVPLEEGVARSFDHAVNMIASFHDVGEMSGGVFEGFFQPLRD